MFCNTIVDFPKCLFDLIFGLNACGKLSQTRVGLFHQSLDELLDRVLAFLSAYSWVFSFKWTELLSSRSLEPLTAYPSDWAEVLSNCNITDLQVLVN